MEANKNYTSWETIQKQFPDCFVLLENPEFDPRQGLKGGRFVYKSKSRKRVIEKDIALRLPHSTLLYTGGVRGDRVNENILIL